MRIAGAGTGCSKGVAGDILQPRLRQTEGRTEIQGANGMESSALKIASIIGVSLMVAAALTSAETGSVNKAEVLFKDTFDGKGNLGVGWNFWKNVSSAANPKQNGGCLVFGRSSSTWAQAAIQTAKPMEIASCQSMVFKFHVRDFGGSSCDAGTGEGATSFIVGEYDKTLDGLYDSSLDGLVLKIEHNAINFGSYPNPAEDPRTWVVIEKTDGTQLSKMVARSTNDFTLVMTLASTWWRLEVEGDCPYPWVAEGEGAMTGDPSGRHGYDLSTWIDGASLRMESWNGEGKFGSVSIEGVSIEAYR